MKNSIINLCRGVNDWWNYIRSYKENKLNEEITDQTVVELHKKINRLEKEKKQHDYITKEKDNLIQLRDKRVQSLSDKYSSIVKKNKELQNKVQVLSSKIDELNALVLEKEEARRKNAGAIGGFKAQINNLTKRLDQANYTIEFYKNHRKSPTLEELKAYEYSRKEVERRQKDITCGTLKSNEVTTSKTRKDTPYTLTSLKK